MGKIVYFVVGDQKLNAGDGIPTKDLEALKQKLLATKVKDDWALVISMHGSVEMLSTVGGIVDAANHPSDVKLYGKDDIDALFVQDQKFVAWKNSFGPTRLTLNSCSVDKPFESALIAALTRQGRTQSSQGLGPGCRPLTTTQTFTDSKNRPIETRAQLGALSDSEKKQFRDSLSELNKKFGYFGSPPVPETQLLDFYFDEPPRGGWPVMTVMAKGHDTGISFFDRAQNVKFLTEECKDHLGPGRQHVPTAPPDPD